MKRSTIGSLLIVAIVIFYAAFVIYNVQKDVEKEAAVKISNAKIEGIREMQAEAVNKGAAKWVVSTNGELGFEWIIK